MGCQSTGSSGEYKMKIIILAAGKGSRLGDPNIPKPLTRLANGKTILGYQLENISQFISLDRVLLVVGYHKERIIDLFPDLLYVYNPSFAKENTSKSLLRALKKCNENEDVLWINGDVVFHPSLLPRMLQLDRTCMLVNQAVVGEEEVKYRSDSSGKILEVSKQVINPQGEALGINLWKGRNVDLLQQELTLCNDHEYFEKGIEMSIKKEMPVWCCHADPTECTEIDFPKDLARANELIQLW
jgi:L-glutamine-phosphate cytidylyltransferase